MEKICQKVNYRLQMHCLLNRNIISSFFLRENVHFGMFVREKIDHCAF